MNTQPVSEWATQQRVIGLFQNELGYYYLGDWREREGNRNIEMELLSKWLRKQKVSEALIQQVLRTLDAAALGEGKKLYEANKEVYQLLRYGVKEKEAAGEQNHRSAHWLGETRGQRLCDCRRSDH